MNKPAIGSTATLVRPSFEAPTEPYMVLGTVVECPDEWKSYDWATAPNVVWAIWGDDKEPTWCLMKDLAVEAVCKHCRAKIVRVNERWMTKEVIFPQYCWVDPAHGSQLHDPA